MSLHAGRTARYILRLSRNPLGRNSLVELQEEHELVNSDLLPGQLRFIASNRRDSSDIRKARQEGWLKL